VGKFRYKIFIHIKYAKIIKKTIKKTSIPWSTDKIRHKKIGKKEEKILIKIRIITKL